jgi:16S rRNA processing protein RimM
MLQIDKKDCTAIGYIQKPHGIKGDVIVVIDDEFSDSFDSAEYFFVELDGGLVPFFIGEEGLRYRNNESIIVKFDFVDSQAKAKELAGCKVFAFNSDLIEPEFPEIYSSLIGMEVIDKKSGEIGKISRIDDFSGNIVITVAHSHAEILIPLSDNIITKIDEKHKKLYLTCPEGLINIYLE